MKKLEGIMVLALSLLSACVIAQGLDGGCGLMSNTGIDGVFETYGSSAKFPAFQDTNIDILDVGNDRATAFGNIWQIGSRHPEATNNLEIKKNQDSGACVTCMDESNFNDTELYSNCTDPCTKVNMESIKVGNRDAIAFGFAEATNNVKIVANQM